MLLTPIQKQIASDPHRFRVVCIGRRGGKTTLAIEEIKGVALSQNDKRIAYIAPTYQQARDIAWGELKKQLEPITISVNESRLELVVASQDKGQSTITLRGWESIETLRGQLYDFIVIDEIASMRDFERQWQEVIRPTLTDRKGEVLFISTPKGFNHFYDLYNKEKTDTDYKAFHFTSYDNPHLPKEEIDKAREELTEDSFAQEYMADFRKSVGLACPQWSREIHLIPTYTVPPEFQRARGFDYGSTDPTASVRVAIDRDGNWIVERCYKQGGKDKSISDHANAILSQDYGFETIPCYGDPSGAQWFTEFMQYGLYIEPAKRETTAKGWVQFGIEKINQLLKPQPGHSVFMPSKIENAPKLFVLDTQENQALVKEIEHLRWKETAEGATVPILDEYLDPDGHSDLMAALRYLVVSFQQSKKQSYKDLPQFNKEYMKMYE